MAHKLVNSYFEFRKTKNNKSVKLDVYIGYNNKSYSIQQGNESSVCFEKNKDIDQAIMTAELSKEALLFVKKELGL